MKSLNKRLSKLENPKGEYQRLKKKFGFHLPIVESPDGEILNPVPEKDKVEFQKFLDMAKQRGEIFNPMFDL